MGEVKKFLKMEYREDGKAVWVFVELLLLVLAFSLRGSEQYGMALLVAGMYIGSYLVSSFHHRTGTEALLMGCGRYQIKKGVLSCVGCFYHNILLEVGIYLYLLYFYGAVPTVAVYGTALCIFTNAVGMLIGGVAKNEVAGLGACVIFIGANFPKMLFQEEYLRFFSPMAQIGNMKALQWWNLLVLSIFGVAAITKAVLRERKIFLLGAAAILLVMAADIWSHNKRLPVPKGYGEYVDSVLSRVNAMNAECGMAGYQNLIVYKEAYYPWKPNQGKMVFCQKEGTLYMNCFTESLCALEEEEIVARWSVAALKPENKYQQAVREVYVQYLVGNEGFINRFTYGQQIKEYGEVLAPIYGVAAETIRKEKERYGELYQFAEGLKEGGDVIGAWEEREGGQ